MSAVTIVTSATSVRAARVSGKAPASRGVAFRASAGVRGIATPRSAVLRRRAARAVLSVRASDDVADAPLSPAEVASPAPAPPALEPVPDTFSKICDFEDLPRGDRRKVDALGKSILIFWYKDSVVCIESRSPAEGAFSEGFTNARLTQDGCIVCPSTASTFDLRTGEIKSWYPENPVLRRLTPIETCRPMEVFPVLARADGIFVDVKNGSLGPDFRAATTSGGSDTSLENNNVYAVEPRMYVQGENGEEVAVDDVGSDMGKMDPGTLAISIAGVAALALGGSAVCVFYENYFALGALWLVGFGLAAKKGLEVTGALDDEITRGWCS